MSLETVRLKPWVIDPRADGSAESRKQPSHMLKYSAAVSQSIDPHLCGILFLTLAICPAVQQAAGPTEPAHLSGEAKCRGQEMF